MKLVGWIVLGSLAVGCASSPANDTAEATSRVTAKSPSRSDKERIAASLSRSLKNGPSTTAAPIYAFLHVADDQLANEHSAGAGIGNVNYNGCYDDVPTSDGVRCLVDRPCDKQPPPPPEQWFDVGPITVTTSLDTMEMTFTESYYNTGSRPGPGWRGDGDTIRVSFAGKAGVVPAFDFEGPAPISDATSLLPTAPIPRTSPLHLEWSYGASSADATTDMYVILFQGERVAACAVPISRRQVDVPVGVLNVFDVGQADLYLTTNRSELQTPVVVKNLIATPSFQAEVDVSGHDGKIQFE